MGTMADKDSPLHSIIEHFKALTLDPETTVDEANKRRTASYYEKAAQAKATTGAAGVEVSHARLVELRRKEMDRILTHWTRGDISHRAIVVMCDATTSKVLEDAREKILRPLGEWSTDPETTGAWIPELSIIPPGDMHVTVALPWWWHTISDPEENHELSKELAARFHQALLLEFHHPFQIELERIVLLGGKTLVALWRAVGERISEDGIVIYDRHGESIDPFVRLREEIVRCYTTASPDGRRQPLTHSHKTANNEIPLPPTGGRRSVMPLDPSKALEQAQSPSKRHTIMTKTPGMGGDMGQTTDGFIHTSLCRLPLDCMSDHDIDLGQIHRLCDEASATLSGHRMVISKYRFIESRGEGGESNPCVNPIYDETFDAPFDFDGNAPEGRAKKRITQPNL